MTFYSVINLVATESGVRQFVPNEHGQELCERKIGI
jgi:hypothetical protein